jgi:hypothetical protein
MHSQSTELSLWIHSKGRWTPNAQKLQMNKTTKCANFSELFFFFPNKKLPKFLHEVSGAFWSPLKWTDTKRHYIQLLKFCVPIGPGRGLFLVTFKEAKTRQVPPSERGPRLPWHPRTPVWSFVHHPFHPYIFQALGLDFPKKCVDHVNGNQFPNCVETHVNDSPRFQTKTSPALQERSPRSSLRGPPPPRPFPGEERALCVRWGLR